MKILFQGSWKGNRDIPQSREKIEIYCKVLAKFIVEYDHTIVLTSNNDFEKLIAEEINKLLPNSQVRIKYHILFLLPERIDDLPNIGSVHKLGDLKWWQDQRTSFIHQADCLIAIGGGKGTSDCIQKAILANKPVFVAGQIVCNASKTWKQRPSEYKYFKHGDTNFTEDLNSTPEFFFQSVFAILKKQKENIEFSRNIFIVHGREHHERDKLVLLLNKLDFYPIILEKEANNGLTIIEKLERDIHNVGFGFVLYTSDDTGRLKDGIEKPRSRQNVVFEHGYLFGLLGRGRTCALVKDEIEIPSDLEGVIYEKYSDLEQESIKIAKILKAAGYKVDPTKLI